MFEGQISVPSVRQASAFLCLFVGVLLATGIIIYFVGLVVEKTGLSGTDRMLGVIFGILVNNDPITWKIALGSLMTLVGVGIIQIRESLMVKEAQPSEAGV